MIDICVACPLASCVDEETTAHQISPFHMPPSPRLAVRVKGPRFLFHGVHRRAFETARQRLLSLTGRLDSFRRPYTSHPERRAHIRDLTIIRTVSQER